MAVVLVTDCPHCSAENTTFLLRSSYQTSENSGVYWMTFQCPRCWSAITARGTSTNRLPPDKQSGDVAYFFTQIVSFPKRQPISAPEHLPQEVQRLYLQACGCRERGNKASDAAAMTYRKTLEVALKILSPEISAWNLEKRIDKMAEQHLITPAIAEWAHEIRLDGNDAAHSEEPTPEAIEQLHYFVHVFLLYTFTLPAMVEQRKK